MMFALALAALILGPLLYHMLLTLGRGGRALDRVLVLLVGILSLAALPEAVETGGWWSLGFVALGLALPTGIELLLRHGTRHVHLAALVLGMAGLALHSMADGLALSDASHPEATVPLAVVLHRLPVGFTIWWLMRDQFGTAAALAVLMFMVGGTAVGYLVDVAPFFDDAPVALGWFHGLVIGTLLHLALHRGLGHRHHHYDHGGRH